MFIPFFVLFVICCASYWLLLKPRSRMMGCFTVDAFKFTVQWGQTANCCCLKYPYVVTVHQWDAQNVCNSTIGFGSIKFYTNRRMF